MQYYGQFETDRVIEEFFPDKQSGKCVDIGAADGKRGSNTLLFEERGWSCLCVEPNPELARQCKWVARRKNVIQSACGAFYSNEEPFTVYTIGERNIMTSVSGLKPDKRLVKDHLHIINQQDTIPVTVRTIDSILSEYDWDKDDETIDFISIDTEGTELDVLKGFDFDSYDVTLFVIENNYNDADIPHYMGDKGYTRVKRHHINDFYVKL